MFGFVVIITIPFLEISLYNNQTLGVKFLVPRSTCKPYFRNVHITNI